MFMETTTIRLVYLRQHFSQTLLDQFVALYNTAFPDPSEREDPAQWHAMLLSQVPPPQPHLDVVVAVVDQSGKPEVVAGLAFEYYRESSCGLLTYLVVNPSHRRHGLARKLVQAAIAGLQRTAAAAKRPLCAVFSETEDPAQITTVSAGIAPADRLTALARLGARWIDIPYVQPELVGGSGRSRHLLLLAFPVGEADIAVQGAAPVRAFLNEFYRALNVAQPAADEDFRVMIAALEGGVSYGHFELPALALQDVAIALHFVEYLAPTELQPRRAYPDNRTFHSMELDLLAYQFQEQPPLGSKTYGAALPLTITFPVHLTYFSEGRAIPLRTARPTLRATVNLSSTRFLDSGLRVWHAVIRPAPDAWFDEYAVIKLIHLYDGRAENTKLRTAGRVHFAFRAPESETENSWDGADAFLQALRVAFKAGTAHAALTAGTIQIITGGQQHDQWIRCARNACAESEREKNHALVKGWMAAASVESRVLKAYAGIITGIFDFAELDTEELLDTFEPTFSDADLFIRINRASLLQMAPHDRAKEAVVASVGISPYLIIPHALLLHNEQLVKSAEITLEQALRRSDRLTAMEDAYRLADMQLRYYHLPNIFNYRTERTLFERGAQDRGSRDRRTDVLEKLDELKERTKARWLRRQDLGRIIIASVLALFTGLQTRELFIKVMGMSEMPAAALSLVVALVLAATVLGISLFGVRRER
jgi:GNAT superfamily N-acetyltransferase